MKIAILGYGIEGKMLEELYLRSPFGQPLIKDGDRNDYETCKKLDILNVCIPYSEDFIYIVSQEILKYCCDLTIIHSIVPPYTTKTIRKKARQYKHVVHSPIRFCRKDLSRSLTIFVKYIGAENMTDAKMTREHFRMIGMFKNTIMNPAFLTELNSILSIVYYGHNIVFADYLQEVFENFKGIGKPSFEPFIHFNESYNRAYRRFRMKYLNRPTLVPPENKKIGNNILPYTKLLHNMFPHEITKRILTYE